MSLDSAELELDLNNNLSEEENVTKLENLGEVKKQALYEAFKKNDHFLGGSETTVTTSQPLDSFNGWTLQ